MASSSWPQPASRQPNLWEYLGLPKKLQGSAAIPCAVGLVLLPTMVVESCHPNQLLFQFIVRVIFYKLQLFFHHPSLLSSQRLTIAFKAKFLNKDNKALHKLYLPTSPLSGFLPLRPLTFAPAPLTFFQSILPAVFPPTTGTLHMLLPVLWMIFLLSSLINSSLPFKSQFKH